MRIFYVGLEPYESRYTLQLKDWTLTEYNRLKMEYIDVPGKFPAKKPYAGRIEVGQALDAHVRPYFAMSQIQWLIERLEPGGIFGKSDWIYFEDMFHPGIESLFYVLSQMPIEKRPYIGMKNQAQTIDPDDFTNYQGMSKWMRHYEQMVINFVDCIFINSPEMVNFAVTAGWREKVTLAQVGHYINPDMVRSFLEEPLTNWSKKRDRVVFASRLVAEKQPLFFKAVAEEVWRDRFFKHIEFIILSGVSANSTRLGQDMLNWANTTVGINILDNLSKKDYYHILNNSKVMFNCAFQDWVSYVLLEASALRMNVLFPAYRSFPYALNNNADLLYVPWSVTDAAEKLKKLLLIYNPGSGYPSVANSSAVEKTIAVMKAIASFKSEERSEGLKYILPRTLAHQTGEQYAIDPVVYPGRI